MSIFPFGKKSVEQIIKEGVKNETEFKQLVEEACSRGAVYAKLFLDAHAPEKKTAEDVLITGITQMTKEKNVLYCKGEIEESVESNGLYSSYAAIQVITTNFNTLVRLAMRYAPTGVEVMNSQKLSVSVKEAQDILLDVSQQSQIYSRFILERAMTDEQKVDFAERVKRKVDYGAKLRQKAVEKLSKAVDEDSKVV